MGEARARDEATAEAAREMAALKEVRLTVQQGVVVKAVELGVHVLIGIARQLQMDWKETEAAEAVMSSATHLEKFKVRYLRGIASRVVIARPGDMPPLPVEVKTRGILR